MLSMTTDYAADTGCPEPYLKRIAEAGFSHVHWCHQWNTDFVYSEHEIEAIARWLKDYGLGLFDLHASAGREKGWGSPREYERAAGVELVRNRMDMAARLGTDVIILHLPPASEGEGRDDAYWTRLLRSLDELRPCASGRGVRIAIENGDFDAIEKVLSSSGPEYVGLCYDSGHGNVRGDGLDRLDGLKDRLISIHLHDNDGSGDQHRLPFSGTVDWPRLARIIAESSYEKCVSMEVSMRNSGFADEDAFLAEAFEAGIALSGMIDEGARDPSG